jgi:hypothetical protein
MQFLRRLIRGGAGGAVIFMAAVAAAQAPLLVYSDHLVNGFQSWSWGTINTANTSPVNTGTNSISLSGTAWNVAFSAHQNDFNATPYSNLVFWANGGAGGGQVLQAYAEFGTNTGPAKTLSALPANSWQQFTVALSSIGVAKATNLNRLTLQLTSSGTTNTFFLDDIQLTPAPPPATVHVSLNATQLVRTADFRWFGANTAVWDGNYDTPTTSAALKEAGVRILRFPGGSLSDQFHWRSNYVIANPPWTAQTWFTNFAHVATNVGAQAIITANYGSGSPAEAAAWVSYSNITNRYGFTYWEIGNENYGTWEFDENTNAPYRANDGWTYATRAATYYQQMKAADPTIKVGIVLTPGEDSSINGNTNHPATNMVSGQIHYGWTPVVLATLKGLGVTPDFAVHHRYPEYSSAYPVDCPDSDPLLLQSSGGWTQDTADLRAQITGYFGPAGTNIELLCTENNSDAGYQGRQSTSLVNGLFYADSLAALMQTELNAFVWWDLRNGTDLKGSFDSTLYGWRTYGDLGLINGLNTRHPTYFAAKLMQYFVQPGDTILSASSDFVLLPAYAARRASGAVSLLVINTDTTTNFNAQIALAGFFPGTNATVRSYGIPQDEAARTNAPIQAQDIATNNFSGASAGFNFSFPPLSLSLFTLNPAAPRVAVVPPARAGGQFVLQIQGQPYVRYVTQASSNLSTWTNVSTNTLVGSTLNITNPIPAGATVQFWRAVWLP